MTSYLIKSILCSGIFILVYHLFLEREKMLHFNRGYLLLTVIFSLVIPLISFEIEPAGNTAATFSVAPKIVENIDKIARNVPVLTSKKQDLSFEISRYLPYFFYLVSLILLIRFARNLWSVIRLKSKYDQVSFEGANLVLVSSEIITFSFLNNIFLSKHTFENEQVRDEILMHELAHVKQMHSLDILFLELAQVFMFFNPFLIFYKKAIRLNHEFLADEAVLSRYQDVTSYQLLLLDSVLDQRNVSLTSRFNYSITKKRLAMMTKIRNVGRQYAKQGMIALLTLALGFVFSEKIYSQTDKTSEKPLKVKAIPFKTTNGEGISEEKMKEFNETIKNHTHIVKDVSGNMGREVRIEPKLKEHLYDLYTQMSKEQQNAIREAGILLAIDNPEKKAPTKAMFENWKKPAVFGVWLDGHHVPNKELDKLKNTDIAEYDLSKLYGAAKKGRSYQYQLDLTTNKNFDENFEARINDRVSIYLLNLFEKKK